MKAQLPPATQTKFDAVLAKLLECLRGAREQTSARSEFMNYGSSMGGQVLVSAPPIEHSYQDVSQLYQAMFAQAKEEGLDLREFQLEFEREKAGSWGYKTRWITADEFKAFEKSATPLVEEIRVALRKTAAAAAADWYSVSYSVEATSKPKVIVLHGEKVRIVSEPTPELTQLAARVGQSAAAQGLAFTGASWRVKDEMDDAEGEIDSALRVIRAWPEGS
jgi:hypothetical protein